MSNTTNLVLLTISSTLVVHGYTNLGDCYQVPSGVGGGRLLLGGPGTCGSCVVSNQKKFFMHLLKDYASPHTVSAWQARRLGSLGKVDYNFPKRPTSSRHHV